MKLTKECLNLVSNGKVASDPNNNFDENPVKNGKISENVEEEEKLYDYFGFKFRSEIKWVNVISLAILHIAGVYAILRLIVDDSLPRYTTLWSMLKKPM